MLSEVTEQKSALSTGVKNFTMSEHGSVEEISTPDPYGGNPGLDI
jgi:hypothetical protein